MALSSPIKQKVFDPVRHIWVAALPEELVRQKLLQKMIGELGFPRAHLAVEKELKELVLQRTAEPIPERRVDIVCLAPDIHPAFPLSPLLLVECKDKLAFGSASEQLFGYNQYVGAPFLLLADERELRFSYITPKGRKWISFLPRYQELIDAVRS